MYSRWTTPSQSKNTVKMMTLKCFCHTLVCAALIASSLKAFWIIQIISGEECSSLMQNLMRVCCSTHSVILNAMATQYTCLLNVYCPHWLVWWSHHCLCMHIPVHSPWLPGYINVVQTILVILTMAVLFPDRPLKIFKDTVQMPSPEVSTNVISLFHTCDTTHAPADPP